jgi:hypothetical protein
MGLNSSGAAAPGQVYYQSFSMRTIR